MVRIVVLLLLISCSTDRGSLTKPPDTVQAINDLIDIQVNEKDQIRKERVIKVLQDCGSYSLEAYDRYIQCTSEASTLKTRISSLEKELEQLKEELQTWRIIKWISYTILALYLIYKLVQVYLKYKPI